MSALKMLLSSLGLGFLNEACTSCELEERLVLEQSSQDMGSVPRG